MTRLAVLLFSVMCGSAAATEHPCQHSVRVDGKVLPQSTHIGLKVKESHRTFALAGLQAETAIPIDGVLELYSSSQHPDRYGRILVQAFQGKDWVQGSLLSSGRALAFGLEESADCLRAMREAEAVARQKKAGIWAGKTFPLSALELDELAERYGHFAVVEGKVISVGNRQRRLYLNFGKKWKQDFTVSVVKKGSGAFKGTKAVTLDDLTRLSGQKVRIRGVLEERQGPLMRLFNEAQIEILE